MSDKQPLAFSPTQYGFEWGGAIVQRHIADSSTGHVVLSVKGRKRKDNIDIYVSRTGKIRVYGNGWEWRPRLP